MDAAFDLLGRAARGLRLTAATRSRTAGASVPLGGHRRRHPAARARPRPGRWRRSARPRRRRPLFGLATRPRGPPRQRRRRRCSAVCTIAWIDGRRGRDAAARRRGRRHGVRPARACRHRGGPRAAARPRSRTPTRSFNAGRAALLVAALTAAPERLISATEDRLHQSYRAEAMPDSYKLLRQLRGRGRARRSSPAPARPCWPSPTDSTTGPPPDGCGASCACRLEAPTLRA